MKDIPYPPGPKLEVRDLRLVLALNSEKTTARAAEVLHLAQPSVSRALLSLEDRLGISLFERTRRGLIPTKAAGRLVQKAEVWLAELCELERSIVEPATTRPSVNLVCECFTAYHWLPSVITSLRAEGIEAEIQLQPQHTKDALAALAEGSVDAALVTSPCKSSQTLSVGTLFADEIVFVVGATHALAKKGTLGPQDLREHPLLTSTPTAHEGQWFMTRVFGRGRPRLNVSHIPLTEAMIALARSGMGIAIISEWALRPYLDGPGVVVKRLSKGSLRRPWRLAWRREFNDIGSKLRRALRAHHETTRLVR